MPKMGREGLFLPTHEGNHLNRLIETVQIVPFNLSSCKIEGVNHLLDHPGGGSLPSKTSQVFKGRIIFLVTFFLLFFCGRATSPSHKTGTV